ncbi:addiction module HigA family antidote [Sphingomonas vulcanisoli]|uniref:Addiction module HigA family antidote n=1 Tax=Sphingomonas vulcanisoli TaxID=1658060 RepID=A0ABX0TXH9_9SPHN|nr:HigA family addiction module antitoxin [Sphingomonas vulcanisoli]NIJ09105.1 addiction module HigA family antidote [Sphingomonas vulcanisoli]
MSGSRTIIEESDRLPNVHPGDILREDFLIGSDISVGEVALSAGIARPRLEAVVASSAAIDADIDLRLARYFGMSEGFFLGLQADYDLEEVKRLHGEELDRIVPRAA